MRKPGYYWVKKNDRWLVQWFFKFSKEIVEDNEDVSYGVWLKSQHDYSNCVDNNYWDDIEEIRLMEPNR